MQLKASVYRPSFLPLPSLPFIAACSRALLYGAFYGAGYQTEILGPLLCLKMERRFKLKLSASGMLDRLRSDVLIFDNSVAKICLSQALRIRFSSYPIADPFPN